MAVSSVKELWPSVCYFKCRPKRHFALTSFTLSSVDARSQKAVVEKSIKTGPEHYSSEMLLQLVAVWTHQRTTYSAAKDGIDMHALFV